jgi:hypothetical protein
MAGGEEATMTAGPELAGLPVLSTDGTEMGVVARVYPSDDAPEWVKLDQVRPDVGPVIVPLRYAERRRGGLLVPFSPDELAGAPAVDAGDALDSADTAALASYYDDIRGGARSGPDADVVPLPPRGQEKRTPSEGPGDRDPV